VAPLAIWLGTIEISWPHGNGPNRLRPAFTNVTTWASRQDESRDKCIHRLESYGWKLLDIERCNPISEDGDFSEEIEDMIERTRTNPKAIVYGTFYSYPVM
jgi:hypothetical protein